MSEETEMNSNAPTCKVDDKVRIANEKNIFNKCYIENWSKEIFVIDFDFAVKTNPWAYENEDSN